MGVAEVVVNRLENSTRNSSLTFFRSVLIPAEANMVGVEPLFVFLWMTNSGRVVINDLVVQSRCLDVR